MNNIDSTKPIRYIFFLSIVIIGFLTILNIEIMKIWDIQIMYCLWLIVGFRCSRASLNDGKIGRLSSIIFIILNVISLIYYYFKQKDLFLIPFLLVSFTTMMTFFIVLIAFLSFLSHYGNENIRLNS